MNITKARQNFQIANEEMRLDLRVRVAMTREKFHAAHQDIRSILRGSGVSIRQTHQDAVHQEVKSLLAEAERTARRSTRTANRETRKHERREFWGFQQHLWTGKTSNEVVAEELGINDKPLLSFAGAVEKVIGITLSLGLIVIGYPVSEINNARKFVKDYLTAPNKDLKAIYLKVAKTYESKAMSVSAARYYGKAGIKQLARA